MKIDWSVITVLLPNLPQKPSQGTFEIEMFNKCFVGFSSWCFLSRRIWCIWVGLADQRSLFWCIITSKHNAAKYFWKRFYIILMYYNFIFMAFSTATFFHVPNKDFLMFMATKEMFCGLLASENLNYESLFGKLQTINLMLFMLWNIKFLASSYFMWL